MNEARSEAEARHASGAPPGVFGGARSPRAQSPHPRFAFPLETSAAAVAGRHATLPICAIVLAALVACGGSDAPVGRAPSAVVACELLSVDEVAAALGVALRVDRETQPQDWICNWTEVERDVPAAQLLVTTSFYSTFEEFRDELESDLEVEVVPVDGVGEWAAWAGDSMLMAKDGNRFVQLTIFAESTLEVARPLVRSAIDRLPH